MLRDHFHPPLLGARHWEAFHSDWAGNLAADLNRKLPEGWFAEPSVHFGIEIAPDVVSWNPTGIPADEHAIESAWQPSAPQLTLDFPLITDIVQVDVFDGTAGPVLAGAIELVSPSNKDRRESRDAFVSKCEALLREARGLVVIDIVTARRANLHHELLTRLGQSMSGPGTIYTASYGPAARDDLTVLDIWLETLSIGGPLPSMPLFLKHGPCVQVDLAGTYQLTLDRQRIA